MNELIKTTNVLVSITNFHNGPWLQYDGEMFRLYKIRFIFKHGLQGGLHHFVNLDELEKAIGEVCIFFRIKKKKLIEI